MRLKEIEQRLAAIRQELETRAAELNAEQLTALEQEVQQLQEERNGLMQQAERRTALLAQLAAGAVHEEGGAQIEPTVLRALPRNDQHERRAEVHPTDTVEYRRAFMEFVCRGVEMPRELRTGGEEGSPNYTTVAETGAVIPNTIMQEIITKLESYGNLYEKFRKINVQGGVSIPIADLKPEAHWVGEGAGTDQKITAKNSVIFNYYGLEVKLSQSILASVVTLDTFQKMFVPLAAEAMVKAIEVAAINGTGAEDSMPLGVTKDPRVTDVVELAPDQITTWDGWHKNVKSKIKKAYRNGVFIMNQSTFDTYIDGMVDKNGQPVGRVNYGVNGEESYRFMGKGVETVEDDVIASYDEADNGEVIAVFMKLSDYVINSNMQMTATKWTDHDNNKIKNKLMMVVDGKVADPNGVIIIKKKAQG